jgi:hypothetical protein
MRKATIFAFLFFGLLCLPLANAEDLADRVKKAAAESTLDQPGTKPFHLRAELTPSYARENAPDRTGTVEIWWKSPTEWRREVSCPIFHQVQVVKGSNIWQKNDGDYFPDWLRETAVKLIDPLPRPELQEALSQIDGADIKHMMGSTYIEWMIPSSNGQAKSWIGATVALTDSTGLLFCDEGGLFGDYRKFHGRTVAYKVSVGSPEVTARVTTLEELKETAGLLDPPASGGDAQLLETVTLDEATTRKNLDPADPAASVEAMPGPGDGIATADVVIDRRGRVREVEVVVSPNQSLEGIARHQMETMRYKPFLRDGVPVQVITRITIAYKKEPGS